MKAHGNYELPDANDVLIAIENGDIKFAYKTIRLFEFALNNTNFLIADNLDSIDWKVLIKKAME